MGNEIKIIRSNVAGKIPTAAQLLDGMLGLNTADGILYAGLGSKVIAINDYENIKNLPTTVEGYGITNALTLAMRGASSGVASLDASALIPVEQIPLTQMRALSVRRTTTYALTTTATDITFDVVDAVNSSVLIRNATTTSRIDISEAGMYLVLYSGQTVDTTNSSANTFALKKNGVALAQGGCSVITRSATAKFQACALVPCVSGDYLSISGLRGAGNGTVQAGMSVQVIKIDGLKGDRGEPGLMGSNQNAVVFAPYFESVGTGWAVTTLASLGADSLTASLQVRSFDDTSEEGVGVLQYIPPTATKITFDIRWRAATAPAGTANVAFRFHGRSVPLSGAPSAWVSSAAQTLNAVQSTNFTQNQITLNLSDLGLLAGTASQIEISRQGSNVGDTLSGDALVAMIAVVFT